MVTFKGENIELRGSFPQVDSVAPPFTLTTGDLKDCGLDAFGDKKKVLSIFPSIDTPVCATSVRKFFESCKGRKDVALLNISADLPFAAKRFCASEGVDNATCLSTFRSSFANEYGVFIGSGPMQGLCARAVLLLDKDNHILYGELVADIANEPNYEAVLSLL